MPLYDFQCSECDYTFEGFSKIEELRTVLCPICKGSTRILITGSTFHAFPSGWWEHIAQKPLYVSSKRQLKEECDKHGVYAKYLDPPLTLEKPSY